MLTQPLEEILKSCSTIEPDQKAAERSSVNAVPKLPIEHDPEPQVRTLFRVKESATQIQREKPEHRVMIEMKLNGVSVPEIARRLNFCVQTVNTVLRQPWAREYMTQRIKNASPEMLTKMFANAAAESVYTLIDLRDDETCPPAVRKACASDLIDRYLGKPTQRLETTKLDPSKLSDAELASMLPTTDSTQTS